MAERQPKRPKFTDASSSSTPVSGNNYYVFLSFRGPDTRNGFVDHLYHRLRDEGLPFHPNFVFRDNEDLPFGEGIDENLLSAIEHSKVSIPVISENYAGSKWCLRELIHIMKCNESRGQIVLPVLYKVKCEDVKHMRGKFNEAFEFKKLHLDEEVKQQGPAALKKAVRLRVFESEEFAGGREGELIEELIQVIKRKQQHDFLPLLPGNLVGIDDRVDQVMKLVDTNPFKTGIIGICGIGGIGKTTLATNIYNKLSKKFDRRSFLMDIRETIKRKDVEHIQSRLISDITKKPANEVRDSMTGIQMIRSSCEKKKVLILLDDVGEGDHLDKLIGGCNFESGSRIIITCRDKAILKSEYTCYEPEEMNNKDSMLLFSLHAFEKKQPTAKLANLSRDIVATTGGLPLALEIIGSYLKGKDESIWTETLKKLRKVPHMNVQKKLKISYDSLVSQEQRMFLDIACFFIGIDKRIVTYLWEDLNLYPASGLARMIELSLIKYGDNHELKMHDQLRDLGRDIARSATKKLWDRKRLWDEEAMKVLGRKGKNENIKGLRLDERGSREFMEQKSFKKMPRLKFLHVKDVDFDGDFKRSLSNLRWLKWEKCPDSFEATNVHLDKLVVLDLSSDDIRGNCISENWRGWSSIKMERLKVLNLSRCTALKRIPNLSVFKSLKMLILEFCENLEEVDPSIGDVKCLTSLNLSNCFELKKLPSQLGELKDLVSLNLLSCVRLQELPTEIGKLEKLEELTIDGVRIKEIPPSIGSLKELVILNASCESLVRLPESIGQLKKLKELTIDGASIKEIPPSIGSLKELEILNARSCELLIGLPESIGQLINLSTLDLRFCFNFEEFPKSIGSLVNLQCLLLGNVPPPYLEGHISSWDYSENFCFDHIPISIGKLESLTELHLTCAKISELPESIGELRELKILKISRCAELRSLPSTIRKLGKLEELDAIQCDSLEGEVPINGLSSLKILRLGKMSDKVNIFDDLMYEDRRQLLEEDFSDLSSQQHLDLTNCDLPANLTVLEVTCHNCTLPELSHLDHLEELNLQICEYLESIPVLPSGILRLWVFWCGELKALPDLSSLEHLSELRIVGCSELEELRGLEGLKSLRLLSICGCEKLSNLKGLEQLESLRSLEMMELDAPLMNDDLSQIQCLGILKNFESLRIDSCESLERPDISQLTHLQDLWVIECQNIVEIKCLERLKKLRSLNIVYCNSIETLPDLSLFDNLEEIYVNACPKLPKPHDVEGQVKSVRWYLSGGSISGEGG